MCRSRSYVAGFVPVNVKLVCLMELPVKIAYISPDGRAGNPSFLHSGGICSHLIRFYIKSRLSRTLALLYPNWVSILTLASQGYGLNVVATKELRMTATSPALGVKAHVLIV